MYTFSLDHRRRLLKIELIGFWSNETARAFAVDQQAAVATLGCAKGTHLVLADLSQFKIQTQEVVATCKSFIDSAFNSAQRLALVGGEGLARIQSKRVLGRDNMRMFNDSKSAENWLLSSPCVASQRVFALAMLNPGPRVDCLTEPLLHSGWSPLAS